MRAVIRSVRLLVREIVRVSVELNSDGVLSSSEDLIRRTRRKRAESPEVERSSSSQGIYSDE